MNRLIGWFAALTLGAAVLPSQAHSLWVNVIKSEESGHHLSFIGHGHLLPTEETLVPDWGAVKIEHYDLIAPDGRRASLGIPDQTVPPIDKTGNGASVQAGGDIGLRKIVFEPKAAAGVWQIAAATPLSYFVRYKDKSGVERFAGTPIKDIPDLGSVVSSSVYANYMKTQLTIGEVKVVTPTPPLGHALELVPQSDLGTVRAGDTVSFKVLLSGRPLKDYGAYFTARSMSFGIDQVQHARLKGGVGSLRVPSAGQWRIDVSKEAAPAEFHGMEHYATEVQELSLSASFTFDALP